MPLNDESHSSESGGNGGGTGSSSSSLIKSNTVKSFNGKRPRVITTPAWARNLPPDEFPDYDLLPDRRRPSTTSFSNHSNNNNNTQHHHNKTISTSMNQGGPPSSSSSTHHPLTPTSLTQPLPTYIPQSGSAGVDRWWTFTLPTKYGEKVRDYVHSGTAGLLSDDKSGKAKSLSAGGEGSEEEGREKRSGRRGSRDLEKAGVGGGGEERNKEGEDQEGVEPTSHYLRMGARLAPGVFSANQTLAPGWSAPWAPFRRETTRDDGDFTPFRFSEEIPVIPTTMSKTRRFVLENVFAPLVFRFFNLSANICTLGLASHMRLQEKDVGLPGIMGTSTLMAVCISPLALVHIFVTLYIEYFGRPIGLWAISTKMFHTLTELIFICLWSSVFSLALDDLFSSSLNCTTSKRYGASTNSVPSIVGDAQVPGTLAASLCGQQEALIVMIFGSLSLCAAVLVVSLFRIFERVTKKH